MDATKAVRGLQERAARAFPAERITEADGWWLRVAPSCAWWVGTVLPHGDTENLEDRVAEAEDFYAGHGVPAGFQISAGGSPDGLDGLLASRGYRCRTLMSLRVAPTARVLDAESEGALEVRITEDVTPAWFDVWNAVHGHGSDPVGEREMLARVEQPSAYASVLHGEDVLAVGRAVADTGWAGVFGMATLPEARGKGAARAVLAALAGWAGSRGADWMYLQVERGNSAAVRLYERAGFGALCGYHYRIAP